MKAFVNSEMIPKEIMPLAGNFTNIAGRVNVSLMPNAAGSHAGGSLHEQQQQQDAKDAIAFTNVVRRLGYDRMHKRFHAIVLNIRRILTHWN